MTMRRTERIWIRGNETLRRVCHLSKNLFNEANYIVRQTYFTTYKWVRYSELNERLHDSENYKQLPAQTAQQILKLVEKSWKSFFEAKKSYEKNPEKFKARPKPPNYKEKDGEFILVFTNQQCKLENGNLRFPKSMNMEVQTRLNDIEFNQSRIIPHGTGYWIEIVYTKQEPKIKRPNKKRIIGIDPGLRNVVTIANNIGAPAIVVKGGVLKSINQFFNKKCSELERIYAKLAISHTTKKQFRLSNKRRNKIRDYFHKLSRAIVNYCVRHKIGTIVFGHNEGQKQNIELGKITDQNFCFIPTKMFMDQLTYKCSEHGIKLIVHEESYTSKCSFIDNESIEEHSRYAGKRTSCGLFRTAKKILINADVNGAYNIMKKAIPNAFSNGIEGVALHPIRVFTNSNRGF